MVSNIIDENLEYHQNGMMMPSVWSNGGQPDQHMHYMQQMRK